MSASKRKVVSGNHERWMVDFGRIEGRRIRHTYESESLADQAITDHEKARKRLGELWLRLPSPNRNLLITIHDEVRQAGYSLREVWDGFREWKKERASAPVQQSVAFSEAVKELQRRKLKSGKDQRYVDELGKLLLRFARGQESRPIDQFQADELEAWMDAQNWSSLSTRKSNLGRFSSLWKVALDKRWVSENITERLEKVGKIPIRPEILDNAACLGLLAAAIASDAHRRIIAPLALGLFGGMRPEEIDHPQFGWQSIDLKRGVVTVEGDVAKDGDRRSFTLHPTALAWVRLAHELKNPLPPVNERRLIDSCCEWAGITHWPHDVLRKTCATHLRNHYKDDWRVVRDLGNSIRILLKHYIDLHVSEETSEEFWRLTPAKAESESKRFRASGVSSSR